IFNGESKYSVTFEWDDQIGVPGAIIVRNSHENPFYLKTITLHLKEELGEDIVFVCNSWVYPKERYDYDRIFFSNKSYLPSETPEPLRFYREQELVNLRGDGTKELKEYDRVYDYAFYNDLGNPDKGPQDARQTLGGSSEFPYPRRGRTGRRPTRTDSSCESGIPLPLSLSVYVPRDERFGHLKMSDFLAYGLKFLAQDIGPALEGYFDGTEEIDSFKELFDMFEGGLKLPPQVLDAIRKSMPLELLKEIFRSDGENFPKFPKPDIIKEDKWAWRTDAEFARETVAGVNPVVIRRLEEFPPTSKLDPSLYGDQNSKITEDLIEKNLEGYNVYQALYDNKLYILDYHDAFMPYLRKINTTATKIYATRTLFFLKNDGTLKPLAIELSLPHKDSDRYGAVSKVYTPASEGVEGTLWTLAKAYAAVNDSGYHQLISHWLNTHAVVEPFVIATNRQLSTIHPIYKLLQPHFRDTMFINALARQTLINAGGILEKTVFPGKFALEMSAVVYKKNWVFTEQGLPADLIKRGVAVKDSSAPRGLRLLIPDYPFAVDGLEIWSAIYQWVEEYIAFYYKSDDAVKKDTELQAWWKELREVGHGDKKNEPWWPKLHTRHELVESSTTLVWIASALHAAVNFGQYPYAGFLPNRPTVSRRFIPEEGTPEYEELKTNPDKAFFKTITSELMAILGVSLIEILSRHASDEVYLGQRDTKDWTAETEPLQAFKKFGEKLAQIEDRILSRNNDANLKNRVGPVKFPYTLLVPSSKEGLTARGIPNSISI
ncbi:probable linoleate 9S-lipoxygenase 5, partial [Morus notabilis]|uniref:probable linoleate 9S-lipoxygenase 5 n=1 Tax=Morus notabilis TaxID=981085 RepID=UPI000CED0381